MRAFKILYLTVYCAVFYKLPPWYWISGTNLVPDKRYAYVYTINTPATFVKVADAKEFYQSAVIFMVPVLK